MKDAGIQTKEERFSDFLEPDPEVESSRQTKGGVILGKPGL